MKRTKRSRFSVTFALLVLGMAALAGCRTRVEKKDTLRLALPATPRVFRGLGTGDWGVAATLVQETLLDVENGNGAAPRLARRWELDGDGVTFTFSLDETARWSDNAPVTAQDVSFSFKAVLDPSNRFLEPVRRRLGAVRWQRAEGERVFRICMEAPHWAHLMRIGQVPIMPARLYAGPKASIPGDHASLLVGSGPYLVETNEASLLVLRKDGDYWAQTNNRVPHLRDYFVFDRLVFRRVKEHQSAADLLRKGEIDLLAMNGKIGENLDRPKGWFQTSTNLARLELAFENPPSWGCVMLNLRQGPLKDRDFRRALQHLLHREKMEKKWYDGRLVAVRSPFASMPDFVSGQKPIPYDPGEAKRLLCGLGYVQADGKGILTRETLVGEKKLVQRASVDLALRVDGEADNRWADSFREDAAKAGVEIRLRKLDWENTRVFLAERRFEACKIDVPAGSSGSPELFFGGEASSNAGSWNFSGLNDGELSRLLREAGECGDPERRGEIYRRAEARLIDLQPVLFLFQPAKLILVWWKHRVLPSDPPFEANKNVETWPPFWSRWTPVP